MTWPKVTCEVNLDVLEEAVKALGSASMVRRLRNENRRLLRELRDTQAQLAAAQQSVKDLAAAAADLSRKGPEVTYRSHHLRLVPGEGDGTEPGQPEPSGAQLRLASWKGAVR